MLKLLIFLFSLNLQAALLNKITAIFDDEVITHSEIVRAQKNHRSRSVIAPVIYEKEKYNYAELVDIELNAKAIRSHLSEIGLVIDDDQVEKTIQSFLSSRRSNRRELEETLAQQGLTFEEYFELIRWSREFNGLMKYVIEPLVSISEQQIKNEFFRLNADNKTLTIQYNLILYRIPVKTYRKVGESAFINGLKNYQNTGVLPVEVKETEEIDLGKVSEDDLAKGIIETLKRTDEGDFSTPGEDGEFATTYFIRKKNLTETAIYQRSKNAIRGKLFEREARRVLEVWVASEKQKHFIKKF